MKKILERQGITWRQAIDGSTGGPIATAWGVRGWPTVYVLDEEGVIRGTGAMARGAALEALVEKLVAELEQRRAK